MICWLMAKNSNLLLKGLCVKHNVWEQLQYAWFIMKIFLKVCWKIYLKMSCISRESVKAKLEPIWPNHRVRPRPTDLIRKGKTVNSSSSPESSGSGSSWIRQSGMDCKLKSQAWDRVHENTEVEKQNQSKLRRKNFNSGMVQRNTFVMGFTKQTRVKYQFNDPDVDKANIWRNGDPADT